MKKKFELKVMYGDADGYETFTYIAEKENEINLLTFFLEIYKQDLYNFYNRPDLLSWNKTYNNNIDGLIKVINRLASLINCIYKDDKDVFPEEYLDLLGSDSEIELINERLRECILFIGEYFDWNMYNYGMDAQGCPISYLIEDITGYQVITRKEAIKLIKDKMGIDVIFSD